MEEENDADNDKNIISNWFLNENTLLVVSKEEKEVYPTVSVRYEKYGKVHSKKLASLTPDVRVEHNEKMIAMFKKTGKVVKKFRLVSVYDIVSHEFIGPSDMYLYYEACRYEGARPKTLVAKKK